MTWGVALVRGAATAVGLILAASLTFSSRLAHAAPEAVRDEIRLRDGRMLQGRIIERAPGRWVVIETDDGHRRTVAWDAVEEVDTAPVAQIAAPTVTAQATQDAWTKRSGSGPTYELRANISTLDMPERTFHLKGTCSTGSGTVPVSMYGQTASDGAVGFGGGAGGRVGFMYRTPPDKDGASSWWAFRATAGLDLHVYHLHSPVALPPVNGGLCSEVSKGRYELVYESSSSLFVQVPLFIGGHVALGKLDELRWSGVVLGAAWAPSFIHAGALSSRASSHLNPLGLELTVDFAVLHARVHGRPPEPQIRVAFFFAPHTLDSHPAVGTLSMGAVWY